MTSIPDVISPVPTLLLSRTRGNVGWFRDDVTVGDQGQLRWTVGRIVFWNLEKAISGTVYSINYN